MTTGKFDELEIRPHWRAFGVWYLAMLLFGLGPFNNPEAWMKPWQGVVLAVLIGLGVFYHAQASCLSIQGGRIVRRGGLVDRRNLVMELDELGEIRLLRGMIHAVLGVGVLVLIPRGEGEIIKFWGVAQPKAIKAKIETMAGIKPLD